jgi:hypothetical protein
LVQAGVAVLEAVVGRLVPTRLVTFSFHLDGRDYSGLSAALHVVEQITEGPGGTALALADPTRPWRAWLVRERIQ